MEIRRSCGLIKLDTVRNEEIKRRAQVNIDIIEEKKLVGYVHL
jgi:hypothetical protein